MRGIQRRPVDSPRKRPVPRKMFPFDDVIMGRDTAFPFDRLVADCFKTFQDENGLWLELTSVGSITDALILKVMEPPLSCSVVLFTKSDDEEYFCIYIYSYSIRNTRKLPIPFPFRRPICLYKEYLMMLSSQEFFPKWWHKCLANASSTPNTCKS